MSLWKYTWESSTISFGNRVLLPEILHWAVFQEKDKKKIVSLRLKDKLGGFKIRNSKNDEGNGPVNMKEEFQLTYFDSQMTGSFLSDYSFLKWSIESFMMNLSIQNLRNKNLGILKFALEVVLMQQWIENGLICEKICKSRISIFFFLLCDFLNLRGFGQDR